MTPSAFPRLLTARRRATLAILLLPLIYFYPAVIGGVALVQGDGWLANLGLRILTGRMLAIGELPLWNPYLFGGMPLLASVYPGALYPPNWIFALLPPGVAINLVVITTFHLALAGAYRYARVIGLDRAGALLAGVVFAFGGYMVMSLGQTANIASAAWLPWVLLAVEKLRARARWRWVALGACFVALQVFAGVPQMAWYTALVAGVYALFGALTGNGAWSPAFRRNACSLAGAPGKEPFHLKAGLHARFRFFLAFVAMYALGGLLALMQILPLRELQAQGGRAAITYEYFAEFSFPPRQFVAFLIPYFFGGATMPPYRQAYWGADGIFVTGGYVGLLGLLLAFIALLGARRQALVWFWAGVAVVSLLLAFGNYLPLGLNHLLYRLPVYNLFRASFRHQVEFTFACGVLAGWGAHILRRSDPERVQRIARASIGVMATLLVVALLAYRFFASPRVASPSLRDAEALIPICLFVISAMVLWRNARRPRTGAAAWLLVVLFVDLIAYGHALEWRSYRFSVAARLTDPPAVAFIKAREPDWNSFRILSSSAVPFGGDLHDALNFPNNSIARGLQSVNGYDMLRLARPAEALGAISPEGAIADPTALGLAHRGFDLGNVKYLFSDGSKPLDAARWRKLVTFGPVEVYENLRALPRAWFVNGAVIEPEAEVLRTIKEGVLRDGQRFDPAETALLEQEMFNGLAPRIARSSDAAVTITDYAPQRITLRTRHANDGLLVLSEVFYPGWQARVDGVAAPIQRVNYALRGLLLPSGEHQVEMIFVPQSFRWGAFGSGIAALLLLVGFLPAQQLKGATWRLIRNRER